MVSKARLDLPEPERPVTTTRLSRGISTVMFLRLCTRAPCTATVSRGAAFFTVFFAVFLEGIGRVQRIEECQLLHVYVAPFGEPHGHGGFDEDALVREV